MKSNQSVFIKLRGYEFEDYSADGLAAWRDHDIKHPD